MVTKFMVRFRALAVRFIYHLVALEPITTIIGRRAYVVNPKTGYLVPSVAGASPDDGGDDGGGGDDKGDGAKDDAAGDKGKGDDADDDDSADDDDDDGGKKDEPDWKRMSRKHERDRKKAEKERDDLAKKLKDHEDADKTEQEKAVEKAKEEGRTEAKTAAEKDRRHDRLESSAIRLAARGVKIGSGDDAKTVKFDDPDDALVYLERDIAKGDLDEDDLFGSDGKIASDKLEEALVDLLERKPKLRADSGTKADDGDAKKKVEGGADGGKGGGDAKTEPGSVDDHFNAIRRTGKKD